MTCGIWVEFEFRLGKSVQNASDSTVWPKYYNFRIFMRGGKALPLVRVRRNTVAECRALLYKDPIPKKQKKRASYRVPRRIIRLTKPEHRLLIVRLRLGGETFSTISRITGIPRMTCFNICSSFKTRKTILKAERKGRPTTPLP